MAPSALAYVDGGTGSMLIQAALAGVFAAAYGFRGVVTRLINGIKGGASSKSRTSN